MDTTRARAFLQAQLASYRERPYAQLAALVGPNAYRVEVRDQDIVYQIEIDVVWDGEPQGAVRVVGAIDDGGWRAVAPLCDDFIKAPDGSFVDER